MSVETGASTNLAIKELAYRKSDKLEVTLWWVRNTIDTYVHVVDHKTEPPTHHYVNVPVGESPNDVFKHPFAYIIEQPAIELEQ